MSLNGQEENIVKQKISDILVDCARDYYKEIVCHRAIPDGRDGLAEVHRRVLWVMHLNKWDSSKPHIKAAKIVGQVMGDYHPHGDSSIYEASVNMSQSWKNQVSFIDFHGNNGSISTPNAGAMRYTEERLAKITTQLVTADLKSDSVDMVDNFNQDGKEPVVMPTKIPTLLFNGTFGIAAGYMSSIPTHNPREVLTEMIKRIQDDTYEVSLLPDFPCGATICNSADIERTYKDMKLGITKGYSKVVIRSTIEVDSKANKLYITEIPHMVSGESIVSSIKDAIKPPKKKKGAKSIGSNKDLPLITDINNIKNISSGGKVRIRIDCKRGADLEAVKSQLYRYTKCQSSMPILMYYCIGEKFIECSNMTEYFDTFIKFRESTIKRIKTSIIREKRLRMHIIEGLFVILDDDVIEEALAKVRRCKSKQEVLKMFMNDYDLDEVQADKIADYKLYQLASFAIEELQEEYERLDQEIEGELEYFKSKTKIKELMVNEYQEMLDKIFTEKKYPRRTKLENISLSKDAVAVESIPDQDYIMIFTKHGYIKKLEMIKSQKRNTKGISVGKLKDEDYVIGTTVLNSRDSVLIFTDKGMVYTYKVYEIPTSTTSKLGYFLSKDINGEKIVNIIPVTDSEFESGNFGILSATKLNKVKITNLEDYSNTRKTGIISMKLASDKDSVIGVVKLNYEKDNSIIALNSVGNAIRVEFDKIPVIGRTTTGSNLFSSTIVRDKITVQSVAVVNDEADYFLYISSKGLGKLMEIDEFEPQYRGTKGKMAAKIRDKDKAQKLITVKKNDNLVIVSNKNLVKTKISEDEMAVIKRPTYGYKLKKCADGEKVIDIAIEPDTLE